MRQLIDRYRQLYALVLAGQADHRAKQTRADLRRFFLAKKINVDAIEKEVKRLCTSTVSIS